VTALDLIRRAEAAGAHLIVCDGRVRVKPSHPLPDDLVEALRAHKRQILAELTRPPLPTCEEVLDWPLDRVDRRRVRVKIRSRLLGCDLWLLPAGDRSPGDGLPTYTTDEVRELLKLRPEDLADSIQCIHMAKLSFGPAATVEAVTAAR